jgi:hypothetical protein
MIRPVVAVGRDYVLTTSTGGYQYFKRDASGNVDLKNPVPNTGDFSGLFATQVQSYDAEVAQINAKFAGSANQLLAQTCQSIDYYTTPNPITHDIPATPPGCANALYDGDTMYDEYSGHFFIMAKVRRPVWTCDTNGGPGGTGWWDGVQANGNKPPDPCNTTDPNYANAVAGRSIFVAVSKCNALGQDCENPANGWNTYTLAEMHADWAQIMVARGLVMVNYHDAGCYYGQCPNGNVWGFSANDLINAKVPSYKPTPGFQLVPGDFHTKYGLSNPLMLAKMHSPSSSDFPILVTMDVATNGTSTNVGAFNIVPTDPGYIQAASLTPQSPALWDLSPWMSSLTVSGEALAPVASDLVGSLVQDNDAHPVWSSASTGAGGPGALYWAFVDGYTYGGSPLSFPASQGISAFRWPFTSAPLSTAEATLLHPPTLSTDPNQGFQRWDVAASGSPAGYDFPVIEHNQMTGDTVLLFHSYALDGETFVVTPQYAAAGPQSATFFPPVTISTPSGVSSSLASAGGAVDILSNVSDPIRPQVFMTSVASNGGLNPPSASFGPFLTQVPLSDPPIQPVIGANPASLQIPTGGAATTHIAFAAPGASVPSAPVTCTAGGDLGPAQSFSVAADGVTVAITVPPNLSGSFFEGISCTNGIAVTIPVTTTAPTFYASPSSLTLMQGSNAGPTVGTTYLELSDPALQACTTSYQIVGSLPAGVTGGIQGNALTLDVYSTAQTGTYTIDVSTSGCPTDSTTAVTLKVIPYACQPELWCTNQGVAGGLQCGSVPDGCGGTDNCGSCGANQVCSSNMCCTTGYVWNANLNTCSKSAGGGGKPPVCKGTTCS